MEQGLYFNPSYSIANKLILCIVSGGLVELASNKLPDGDQVPTRTIGDPSTGSELTSDVFPPSPSDLSVQADSWSATISRASTSTPTNRPSYVELPKRPTFAPSPLPLPTASQESNASGTSQIPTPRSDVSIFDPPIRVLVVDDDVLTRRVCSKPACIFFFNLTPFN